MTYQLPRIQTRIVKEGEYPSEIGRISGADDVARVMADFYEGADREKIFVLCLDRKNQILSIECVAIGTVDACLAAGRELFKAAILCNAAGILMVHNHPSGSAIPSKEDEEISRRFYQAGKLLGIGLLDHVIYGDREHYYSFRQEGFFDAV